MVCERRDAIRCQATAGSAAARSVAACWTFHVAKSAAESAAARRRWTGKPDDCWQPCHLVCATHYCASKGWYFIIVVIIIFYAQLWQRAKNRSQKHMLEWLEVQLDTGDDKRLIHEYHIEPLNCDRDALKQECHLACIAHSGTQLPTHLSEKIQRASSYCLQSFECDWYKKLGRQEYLNIYVSLFRQ